MSAEEAERPKYFAERRSGSGVRYYWRATSPLKQRLLHSPHPALIRLSDDRGTAEAECRAVTARVAEWLNDSDVPSNADALALDRLRELIRNTPGTLAHAITSYRQTKQYREASNKTRKQYDWMLNIIEERHGPRPISEVTYAWLKDASEELADRPRTQQIFLMLLAWMVERHTNIHLRPGYYAPNPARQILEEIGPPPLPRSWIWPDQAVNSFADAARAIGWPSIGTAIRLNRWLGLELTELLSLPRDAYRNGVLHIVRGGHYHAVPADVIAQCEEAIQEHIATEAATGRASFTADTLLICEGTNHAWKIDNFRHCFSRVRAALASDSSADRSDAEKLEAGGVWPIGGFLLDTVHKRPRGVAAGGTKGLQTVRTIDLKFSHLRHTGIVRLHQIGCADAEIRNITGNLSPHRAYDLYIALSGARTFERWPPLPQSRAITEICKRGEDQLHEFKSKGTELEKLSREIAAMLNTGCGGHLFYGVADETGAIEGSDRTYDSFDQSLQNSVRHSIKPAPHVRISLVPIGANAILVATVPGRGRKDVYYFKGRALIRKGTNVFEATPDEIRKLHEGIDVVDWSSGSNIRAR